MARRPKKKGVISLPVGRISLVLSSHGVCVCVRACVMDLKLATLQVLSVINLTVFRPGSLLYSRP